MGEERLGEMSLFHAALAQEIVGNGRKSVEKQGQKQGVLAVL